MVQEMRKPADIGGLPVGRTVRLKAGTSNSTSERPSNWADKTNKTCRLSNLAHSPSFPTAESYPPYAARQPAMPAMRKTPRNTRVHHGPEHWTLCSGGTGRERQCGCPSGSGAGGRICPPGSLTHIRCRIGCHGQLVCPCLLLSCTGRQAARGTRQFRCVRLLAQGGHLLVKSCTKIPPTPLTRLQMSVYLHL